MDDKKWIEEYVHLLFPVNGSDINISCAQALKKSHTPTKLYKYRTFSPHSLDALKNSDLFVSKAVNLNDPFECAVNVSSDEYFFESLKKQVCKAYKEKHCFSQEELEFLASAPQHDFFDFIESRSAAFSNQKGLLEKFTLAVMKDNHETMNRKISQANLNNILICALSESNDNSLMWSHYANEHKGFCVEYNFAIFNPAPHPSWYLLNPVIYQNHIPDFSKYYCNHDNFNNLIATYAAMVKSESWAYEKEWRLILPWGETAGKGMLIKAPEPTAIFVGCRADEKDIFSLKEIAKSKNIPIYQMKPKNNSFLLYPHKIDE